jgi:hypothetical protein
LIAVTQESCNQPRKRPQEGSQWQAAVSDRERSAASGTKEQQHHQWPRPNRALGGNRTAAGVRAHHAARGSLIVCVTRGGAPEGACHWLLSVAPAELAEGFCAAWMIKVLLSLLFPFTFLLLPSSVRMLQ